MLISPEPLSVFDAFVNRIITHLIKPLFHFGKMNQKSNLYSSYGNREGFPAARCKVGFAVSSKIEEKIVIPPIFSPRLGLSIGPNADDKRILADCIVKGLDGSIRYFT